MHTQLAVEDSVNQCGASYFYELHVCVRPLHHALRNSSAGRGGVAEKRGTSEKGLDERISRDADPSQTTSYLIETKTWIKRYHQEEV